MGGQARSAGWCCPAQLLLPRLAGLRLLPRLWPVLVDALHVSCTQVTVSRNAEAEQSVSAACCTSVMRREQSLVSDAVTCTRMQVSWAWRQVQLASASSLDEQAA